MLVNRVVQIINENEVVFERNDFKKGDTITNGKDAFKIESDEYIWYDPLPWPNSSRSAFPTYRIPNFTGKVGEEWVNQNSKL